MIPLIPRLKTLAWVLPILFTAFTPPTGDRGDTGVPTEYYYALQSLKQAAPPRVVDMIKTDNARLGKRVIRRGTLVTYSNRKAASVRIAGDFNAWKPVPMTRSASGVWYHFLPFGNRAVGDSAGNESEHAPSSAPPIRYKFTVDGIWIADPLNPDRIDDGAGSFVSRIAPGTRPENRHDSYRIIGRGTVEFRCYHPNASYVAVVGDFNAWNPENDVLKKTSAGFWRLTKRLSPGTYRYQYIIDGVWRPDIYNAKSSGDGMGGISSLLVVR